MKLLVGLILFVAYVNCETFIECEDKPAHSFVAGKNCQSYIFCDGGNSYEGKCPPEMAFNFEDLTCDDPENVQCGDVVNPLQSSPRPSTNSQPITSKKPPSIVTKQHPTPPGKPVKPTSSPNASTPKGKPSPPVPPRRRTTLLPAKTTKSNGMHTPPKGVGHPIPSKIPLNRPVPTKKPSTNRPVVTKKPLVTSAPRVTGVPNFKIPTPPGAKGRNVPHSKSDIKLRAIKDTDSYLGQIIVGNESQLKATESEEEMRQKQSIGKLLTRKVK